MNAEAAPGTPATRREALALAAGTVLALGTRTARAEAQADEKGSEDMTNLEFFESLDYDDGIGVVTAVFGRFPLQYGTTLGLDGAPQIRPLEFKFEQDGLLYFDTVEYYASYAEMLAYPHIQVCVCDQETMSYVRLGGTVNFTKDPDVVDRCFEASPVLASQFGDNRDVVVAYYLTEAWAEFSSFSPTLSSRAYDLS